MGKNKKNGASGNDEKKKKKRRNRARNQQEKKEGKRKRKQMRRKKKKERKMKKAKRKDKKRKQQRGRQPDGRQTDSTTCGTTGVSDTCLINAVEALNFEKNQIQNLFKQKARLLNHNKTTGNKLSKNMNFNESADYMLKAIGGDISNPKCGETQGKEKE